MSVATKLVLGTENVRQSEAVDRLCRQAIVYRLALGAAAATIVWLLAVLTCR